MFGFELRYLSCMHYLIYKITNKLNGKIYVGKHKTQDDFDDYFGSGLLLEYAVNKYGKENFVKEIIHRANSNQEMNEMEAKIVDEDFVARSDTYNLKLGGQGGFDYILENKLFVTDKFYAACHENWKIGRDKLAELMTNPEFKAEFSKKISDGLKQFYSTNVNPFKGKKHSDTAREKMRQAKKGKCYGENNPSFGTIWITNGLKSIKIKKSDPIPDGYKKGRLLK